jgi:hypothetical protein
MLSPIFLSPNCRGFNNTEYDGIENEKLDIPPQILKGETASIPQLGTIGTGSASVSIGELMITIKQLFRGNRGQIITGSLENCGSKIKLVACLRGDNSYTCEVQAQNSKDVLNNSLGGLNIATHENKEDNFIYNHPEVYHYDLPRVAKKKL